jgi:hypothetical protein
MGAVLEGTGRSWEGFASGTQAAAAGGVTTVIDLPAHSAPQTTTAAILRRKAVAARGKLHADVGFWGALVPENAEDSDTLLELLAQGALGLSAVVAMGMQPDTQVGSQRALGLAELEAAVGTVAPANRPVLVHAEMVPPSEEQELRQRRASQQLADANGEPAYDGMDYMSWLEVIGPMPNCPMPNCPMPNCPMPNAQCPMPNAQCPMPNAQLPECPNARVPECTKHNAAQAPCIRAANRCIHSLHPKVSRLQPHASRLLPIVPRTAVGRALSLSLTLTLIRTLTLAPTLTRRGRASGRSARCACCLRSPPSRCSPHHGST